MNPFSFKRDRKKKQLTPPRKGPPADVSHITVDEFQPMDWKLPEFQPWPHHFTIETTPREGTGLTLEKLLRAKEIFMRESELEREIRKRIPEMPMELVRLHSKIAELDQRGYFRGRDCRSRFYEGDKVRGIPGITLGDAGKWGVGQETFIQLWMDGLTPLEIFPADMDEIARGMQLLVFSVHWGQRIILPGFLFELHPDHQ